MFFVGIFGIQDKQKEVCNITIECKNCNSKKIKLYKTYRYFHIFFIPIYKWNSRYDAYCDNCSTVYTVPKEKGVKAENGESNMITYWDLEETYKGTVIKHCPNCGSQVNNNFEYCPYCGRKL